MPKVLRIINRLNLGGPTYNVAYLAKFMAPEYETMLVSGIKDDEEESSEFILQQYGIKPVFIDGMRREINFTSDRKAYLELKSIIKKFKPDIVHTHAAKSGTLGRLAAAACKVPVIVHTFHGHVFHSYFSPLKTKLFIEIEKYLARRSSAIVTISELQKQEICNRFKICSQNKATVIPLGFDLTRFSENKQQKRDAFRNRFGISTDEVAVGIVGRFAPVKNHSFFLKAFAHVSKTSNTKTVAVLVGDGEERQNIIDTCNSLGLNFSSAINRNVIFTSWIKEADIAMAGLDIICLTSDNEGTPVSLIEAQAAGKPIVSTNVGGIENVVLPGKTALLSEKGNINEFQQNLNTLIENQTIRTSMSTAGWEYVGEKFHYTRLVSDMKRLYSQLLNQKTTIGSND